MCIKEYQCLKWMAINNKEIQAILVPTHEDCLSVFTSNIVYLSYQHWAMLSGAHKQVLHLTSSV